MTNRLRQILWIVNDNPPWLIAAFHARGIAVILDVVFNHVGLPAHLLLIDRVYYFEQDAAGQARRVVALESTSELLKSASSNVLRFKIDSALPPEFDGKARITGRIVQLPAHDAHEIESYLAIIRRAGLRVEDVEIRKADLEDVFLDLMAAEKVSVDGPPLDAKAPSGGSAGHEVTSVGATSS